MEPFPGMTTIGVLPRIPHVVIAGKSDHTPLSSPEYTIACSRVRGALGESHSIHRFASVASSSNAGLNRLLAAQTHLRQQPAHGDHAEP